MMDVSFWKDPPHMSPSQQVIWWIRVAVTGWRGWHALSLAPALVAAEGQFWWSLSRQDGIVGKAEWWQSSEADIKGSEYTRLSCSAPDRLPGLAGGGVDVRRR